MVEREGVEGGGVAGPLTQHISLGIEETELVPVLCRRADCVRNAKFTIVDDSDSEIVFCLHGDRWSGLCFQGDGFCPCCMGKSVLLKKAWYGAVEERGGVNLYRWGVGNRSQGIMHVDGRPVHVIVFCVLSMAGPFIALYYVLWRSPNIPLLWSGGQPMGGGGGCGPGKIFENCSGMCVWSRVRQPTDWYHVNN